MRDTTDAGARLPALGPRGEGWVVGQLVLLALVGALGLAGANSVPPGSSLGWLAGSLGVLTMGAGVGVGHRGVRDLGASLTAVPWPRDDARLVTNGIYARIRHPLYAALILVSLGWSITCLSAASLVASILLAGWLDAKSRREEAWLAARYPDYAAYRSRTRRFVPGVY